jgi:hypothetical protein
VAKVGNRNNITLFCTECKEGKKGTIEKLEHEYIDEEVLAPATCSSHGVKVYNCKHCGVLKEEQIEKLSHTFKNGSCSVCGISENEVEKYTITVEFNEGIGNDPSGEYTSGDNLYLPNPTKENYTFIWVVIVPLAGLFVYNMFVFVKNMSDMKAEKLALEKGATLSEEEKEALRQAYLKSLEEENKK